MTGVLTAEQMRHAALLHAGERAALDSLTALELRGFANWWTEEIEVLVPHGVVVSPLPGVRLHHTRHLDQIDRTTVGGLSCVTAARATVNAASRQRGRRGAAGLVLAAVQQRIVAPGDLLDCLARLTKVRFVDTIREAAEHAAGGADALTEVTVGRLLRRAGLTSFRRQYVVQTPDGERRYDLAVDLPDHSLLLIEVDGPTHDDPARRAADLAKDAAAVALGHQVLHLPAQVLASDEHRIVTQLARIRTAAEARFGSGKSRQSAS
jgi:very-short-patch-repair endonuclease